MQGRGAVLTSTDQRLSDWTTLRLGGPAGAFVEARTRAELYREVAAGDARGEPVLVLGGGSNLVVADAGFPGTVVRVATSGVEVGGDACSGAEVVVEAGEGWDALVQRCVDAGWIGVEALSGIPGTVGAAPIQNVGAYGQEVAEVIARVHVYDRVERRERTVFAADCAFGYRDSAFKRDPARFVVGAVVFQFRLGELGAPVRYEELARRLGVDVGARVPAREVRAAVLAVRRGKGMVLDPDDHDTWSAGSFFTNPFVSPERLPDGAPAYPQADGRVKTSAAWLIERAGFGKGLRAGQVGLSTKHTLALTNRGGATTEELLGLARQIRSGVEQAFGIVLEPEPTLVGASL